MKKIHLANRSRKNRIFFDQLIRELVICLNTGDVSLNRNLLMPTYVNHKLAGKISEDSNYIKVNYATGLLFCPLSDVLHYKILDALDKMLFEAPLNLKHCNSRHLITEYLASCTDFNDCNFSALNEMQCLR